MWDKLAKILSINDWTWYVQLYLVNKQHNIVTSIKFQRLELIYEKTKLIVKGCHYKLQPTTLALFYMFVQTKHDWCITNNSPM